MQGTNEVTLFKSVTRNVRGYTKQASVRHLSRCVLTSTITGDVSTAITGASRAPVHGVHLGGERGAPSAVHSVHHK